MIVSFTLTDADPFTVYFASIISHLISLAQCRSLQELRLIKSLFPSIDASRILFTPNFACRNEYAKARGLFQDHANAIHLTVDNTWVLENWGEDFASCSIFLRVDPGEDGHGHHAHVHTGSSSKFGIEIKELCSKEFADVLNKHKVRDCLLDTVQCSSHGLSRCVQWFHAPCFECTCTLYLLRSPWLVFTCTRAPASLTLPSGPAAPLR